MANKENTLQPKDIERHMVTMINPHSRNSEQYRKLRTNIEMSNQNTTWKMISVSALNGSKSKPEIAVNLAAVYAQSGKRTLLIDMDLHHPQIHEIFTLPNTNGLTDLVNKETQLNEGIKNVKENFDVLPAGKRVSFPSDFLMHDDLQLWFNDLQQQYDKIIIDTPPLMRSSDGVIISHYVDGTIITMEARKTKIDDAQNAIKQFKENGGTLIGAVLTQIRKKDNRHIQYFTK